MPRREVKMSVQIVNGRIDHRIFEQQLGEAHKLEFFSTTREHFVWNGLNFVVPEPTPYLQRSLIGQTFWVTEESSGYVLHTQNGLTVPVTLVGVEECVTLQEAPQANSLRTVADIIAKVLVAKRAEL